MRVFASETEWKSFLRRAKAAFPNEHCEAVWGEETVDSFRVTDFKKMRLSATCKTIEYDDIELKRQKWEAQEAGKKFLGTVHTHPGKDYDSAPTAHDHHTAALDGERIMGVVLLYKNTAGTRYIIETNWWFPQRRLEFQTDSSL